MASTVFSSLQMCSVASLGSLRSFLFLVLLNGLAGGGGVRTIRATGATVSPEKQTLVDNLIDDMLRAQSMKMAMEKLQLQAFMVDFEQSLGLFSVTEYLKCDSGSANSGPYQRQAPTVVKTKKKKRASLGITLLITRIKFNYNCQLAVRSLFNMNEEIQGTVDGAHVYLQVGVFRQGDGCQSVVDSVKVTKKGTTTVGAGKGIMAHVKNIIYNKLAANYEGEIVRVTKQAIGKYASQMLDNSNICQQLLPLGVV